MAFKDIKTRENWYRNAAEIELQLQKRIYTTKSGDSSLRYFDGATMTSYQIPTRAFETVHCRQEDNPKECDKVLLIGQAVANVSNETTVAYDPVTARRGRDTLHAREYSVHGIDGWKESLLN